MPAVPFRQTVDGAETVSEYTWTSALGRQPSFDPRIDPIARVEAARLRNRLDLYYATEGRADPVTISLPKGGYVPAFELGAPEAIPPLAPSLPPADGAILRIRWQWIAAVSTLLAIAGMGTFTLLHSNAPAVSSLRLSVVPPPNASIESLALSPDVARIVVAATSQNTSSLFLRPLNSFAYQKFSGTEGAWNPFWSPDGASIGFFTLRTLQVVDGGAGAVRTRGGAGGGKGGTWSRAGEIGFGRGALGPLYRISASGGKPVAVTSLDTSRGETGHRWPQFLPDGRHFLYFAAASEYDKMGIDIGDHRFPQLATDCCGGYEYRLRP